MGLFLLDSRRAQLPDPAYAVASGPACCIPDVFMPPSKEPQCPDAVYMYIEEARILQNAGQFKNALMRLELVRNLWEDKSAWPMLSLGLDPAIVRARAAEYLRKAELERIRKQEEEAARKAAEAAEADRLEGERLAREAEAHMFGLADLDDLPAQAAKADAANAKTSASGSGSGGASIASATKGGASSKSNAPNAQTSAASSSSTSAASSASSNTAGYQSGKPEQKSILATLAKAEELEAVRLSNIKVTSSRESELEFYVYLWCAIGSICQSQQDDQTALLYFWRAYCTYQAHYEALHNKSSSSSSSSSSGFNSGSFGDSNRSSTPSSQFLPIGAAFPRAGRANPPPMPRRLLIDIDKVELNSDDEDDLAAAAAASAAASAALVDSSSGREEKASANAMVSSSHDSAGKLGGNTPRRMGEDGGDKGTSPEDGSHSHHEGPENGDEDISDAARRGLDQGEDDVPPAELSTITDYIVWLRTQQDFAHITLEPINPFEFPSPALATIFSGLGLSCLHLGEAALALACFNAAKNVRFMCIPESSVEFVDVGSALNNIGACLVLLKRPSEALAYFEAARDIFVPRLDSAHPRLNIVLNNVEKVRSRTQKITIDVASLRKSLLASANNNGAGAADGAGAPASAPVALSSSAASGGALTPNDLAQIQGRAWTVQLSAYQKMLIDAANAPKKKPKAVKKAKK